MGGSMMRSVDLMIGDSFDGLELIDKASGFGLICAETDRSTKQTRTCLNSLAPSYQGILILSIEL
jgi:hypothetical protein